MARLLLTAEGKPVLLATDRHRAALLRAGVCPAGLAAHLLNPSFCLSMPSLPTWKLLTPGSRALSGTTHPTISMSAFCTHLSAIFFSILPVLKPGFPLRTMNALICLVSRFLAQMTTTSAAGVAAVLYS